MQSKTTKRALQVIEQIKTKGIPRKHNSRMSYANIAKALGILPQDITKLRKHNREIKHDELRKMESVFKINPDFLRCVSDSMFIPEEYKTFKHLDLLRILTDFEEKFPKHFKLKTSVELTDNNKFVNRIVIDIHK